MDRRIRLSPWEHHNENKEKQLARLQHEANYT
jgi:hypothetical protein